MRDSCHITVEHFAPGADFAVISVPAASTWGRNVVRDYVCSQQVEQLGPVTRPGAQFDERRIAPNHIEKVRLREHGSETLGQPEPVGTLAS